jgi:transcriptional regulator with PAS, ATPase and Fis domain
MSENKENLLYFPEKTEEELNEYRKNLDAIFSSIKDGIISLDNNLNVIEFNEAAKIICNLLSPEKHACNNKDCLKALKKTLKTKESAELYRIECHCTNRPSQIVTVTITPLIKGENKENGAVMVIRDETELVETDRMLQKRGQYHNITGKSEKMQEIYSFLEKLASINSTVLITGESGTGKELIAEAIHYKGNRKNNPLVKVNCAALPENLLESELFGHVKGAFTGAIKDKSGWFEKAHRGTIFLDEIGDITPALQLRLLRFLQEKEFVPVGSTKTVKVDARVIASTNEDIARKVKNGTFREDLYYRIKVAEIKLTPLRERLEDIPLLVEHFIKKYNMEFNKAITGISQNVAKIFMTYHWPGNIRELEHTIEHAFILTQQAVITVNDLPDEFKNFSIMVKNYKTIDEAIELKEVLKKTNWKKAKAARLLGMDRKTIYRKMKKYNIPLEKQSENI